MHYTAKFLFKNNRYLFGCMLLLFTSLLCLAFNIGNPNDFDRSKREILLRRIGHEVLLQSGDSVSRILPVQKLTGNDYRISFEKEFTFKSDSLINITERLLADDPLASDYVVNVLIRNKPGVAYEYAISKNKEDQIITCKGRRQPKAPYVINIKFKPAGKKEIANKYLLCSFPFLALIGFMIYRPVKEKRVLSENDGKDTFILGDVFFDANNRSLIVYGNAINLTGTETRLLRIFARSPNETIERNRLQKEIWEDDGIIVGRSLDMFISKLRKKLDPASDIKIIVVRSKGYKLQIGSQI